MSADALEVLIKQFADLIDEDPTNKHFNTFA